MGIRPSAETGSGDGNQLAVDQVGEVYANVKTVGENIDGVILVSENLTAINDIHLNMAALLASGGQAVASAAAAATSASNAATSATNASNSATAAANSEANALAYRNTAQTAATNASTSETTTLGYRNTAQTYMNSASASAIAAATSEANALTYRNAAQASATAAGTSETNAAASAASALAAKNAAETAETNAELAETNAEAAQAAAYAAQLAAEAARDEAEAIAGGDYVLATGDIMTGKLTLVASAAVAGAGINLGNGVAPTTPINGDVWVTSNNFQYRAGGTTYTLATTGMVGNYAPLAGATFTGPVLGPVEAYGAGWNGSAKLVTQDAVYDEIEALKALVVGSVKYISTWNASTNTPAIPAAAAGNKGYYYKVATAGATSIDGITDWKIGDWIISTGTAWEKVDNTDQVSLVNGQSGAVVLDGSHLLLPGFSSATPGPIVAADTVLAAFGKAQNSIDVLATAVNQKANLAGGNSFTGIQTITDASSAELKLTDSGSVVDARIYNDGNLHISCTPRIWFASDIYTFQSAAAVTWLSLTSAGAAVTGEVTATGNIIGLSLIANGANGNFVARGDATNGGQLVLGYGNNLATAITGQDNNTWNIDVPSGNAFRIWRRNAAGVDLIAMSLEEVTGNATFVGTVTTTGDVACNGVTATGTVVTPAITLNGTDLGATLNNKSQARPTIGSQSTNKTANDSDNNSHIVFSGASRTLTLNSTPAAGTSFTGRFTTAWSVTCSSLSKNGATPVANGSIAAGKAVTFLHEGGGTWIAWGDIT